MSKIYYYGTDGKVYGPVTETDVQAWYTSGYFSSEMRFQISASDRFDANGRVFTLGELIEKNGRLLPFYFSTENEKRESEQEETLQKLKKDVESLLANKDRTGEKESLSLIMRRVASMEESFADLHKKVNALSNKKEGSPVTSELDKKVNDLKKKVDELEKNAVSMKKIISDVTSKCDKNDTKFEQAVKKLKEADDNVSVCSAQISQLQEHDKAMSDALATYEQLISNNVSELVSTRSDLNNVKKKIDNQIEESSSIETEQQKIQRDLNGVITAVGEHNVRFTAIEQRDEKLRTELKSLKEETGKSKSTSMSESPKDLPGNSEARPPWEQETKKAVSGLKIEPWNQPASIKKDAYEAKVTKKEKKADMVKGEKPANQAKVAPTPKPTTKNWDAICRDLSSSDDEKEEATHPAAPDLGKSDSLDSTETPGFILALRDYCAALTARDFKILTYEKLTDKLHYVFDEARPEFQPSKAALTQELRVLANKGVYCSFCDFMMTTPSHIVLHFSHPHHYKRGTQQNPAGKMTDTYGTVRVFVTELFKDFFTEHRMTMSFDDDACRVERAQAWFAQFPQNAPLRPYGKFTSNFVQRFLTGLPAGAARKFPFGARKRGVLIQRIIARVRAVRADQEERSKVDAELTKHLQEGIPFCSCCKAAFESIDDYFIHMTAYSHLFQEMTLFSLCLGAWKSEEYYNGFLEL